VAPCRVITGLGGNRVPNSKKMLDIYKTMFLCIWSYLILFAIPVFANPDPWIGQPIEVNGKSYDPQNPPEVALGEYVTIAVGGFNYQGSDAQEQYLQISFPDLTGPASSVEILSTNLPNSYTKPPNSEVWGGYGSYKVTTSYWFVEGYAAPWKSGKSYYLKVRVKPEKAGNFRIFVKTTTLYNGEWFADPTTSGSAKSPEVYSYISGITSDQQNEYVYYYTVTVKQPAAEDKANIVSFTPPSGEFSPGDTISAQVTVKNTGTTTRSFWVGLSYQKPDGSWLGVPPKQTSTLSPGATQTLTFTYILPTDVPEGYYNARAAVWNGYDSANNLMVEPRFDVRDVQSAFRVVPQVANAEIAQLTLDKPNVKPGEAVTATVKILNTGNVGLDYLLIRASIVKDGSTVVGEKTLESGISLPAGGEKTLSLNIWTVPENAESGTYKVVLKLTDMTAEKVYDSEYAFFDVTALPRLNVQLISPSDGEVLTSLPITFMVRVTSNGEPVEGARVMLTFTDGGTSSSGWITTDSNGYAKYTGFSSLSSGSGVSWYAEAYKDGYESGMSEIWYFKYEKANTPPTIYKIYPSGSIINVLAGETVEFKVRVEDPDGNLDKVMWFVNGEEYATHYVSGSSDVDTLAYTFRGDEYVIDALAYDEDGAYSSSVVKWYISIKRPKLVEDGISAIESIKGGLIESKKIVEEHLYEGPVTVTGCAINFIPSHSGELSKEVAFVISKEMTKGGVEVGMKKMKFKMNESEFKSVLFKLDRIRNELSIINMSILDNGDLENYDFVKDMERYYQFISSEGESYPSQLELIVKSHEQKKIIKSFVFVGSHLILIAVGPAGWGVIGSEAVLILSTTMGGASCMLDIADSGNFLTTLATTFNDQGEQALNYALDIEKGIQYLIDKIKDNDYNFPSIDVYPGTRDVLVENTYNKPLKVKIVMEVSWMLQPFRLTTDDIGKQQFFARSWEVTLEPSSEKTFSLELPSSILDWFEKAKRLGYEIEEYSRIIVIYGEGRYQAMKEFESGPQFYPPCNPDSLDGICPKGCSPCEDLDCCKESLMCPDPVIQDYQCLCLGSDRTPIVCSTLGLNINQTSNIHEKIKKSKEFEHNVITTPAPESPPKSIEPLKPKSEKTSKSEQGQSEEKEEEEAQKPEQNLIQSIIETISNIFKGIFKFFG